MSREVLQGFKMSFELYTIQNITCPSNEIAAYIDGELSLSHELELDAHFAHCQVCSNELNQQKLFLRQLDASLKHESELELPENFAFSCRM